MDTVKKNPMISIVFMLLDTMDPIDRHRYCKSIIFVSHVLCALWRFPVHCFQFSQVLSIIHNGHPIFTIDILYTQWTSYIHNGHPMFGLNGHPMVKWENSGGL